MQERDSMPAADCWHGLQWRVAHGLGGVREAFQIAVMRARMACYERALRHIAAHGDADSAARACRALAEDES